MNELKFIYKRINTIFLRTSTKILLSLPILFSFLFSFYVIIGVVTKMNWIVISLLILFTFLISSYFLLSKITTQKRKFSVDENGIMIVDFGTIENTFIGKQKNPVKISEKALSYFDDFRKSGNDTSKKFFLNSANWLVENSINKGKYSIIENTYPYPPYGMPSNPWHDGMGHGLAIEVLLKAHEMTREKIYLQTADKLLKAFFVEVNDEGFTYKTSDKGWWYEHYAHKDGKSPRVLNATIYAMFGIYEYYKYTNDPDAKYLFDQGLTAVKHDLHYYELKNYSYYDRLGLPSPVKYHKIHVNQMKKLYEITQEDIFRKYYEKWNSCNWICQMWERTLAHMKRLPLTLSS